MITLEIVIGFAIRDPVVMDQLGPALRSDLVTANPHYRRIVEFADDFLLQRRKLPGSGDWSLWLEGLTEGVVRDGTREALGRLLSVDVSGFDSAFFGEQAITHLRKAAVGVARARLNEVPSLDPEAFTTLAKKLEDVQPGTLQGLARLSDLSTWAVADRETDYIPTGYPTLNQYIGGWGKELWMVFADSGVGKSMLLQNFAAAIAVRGKRVLHVTLELGLRPQIHRYYRQIAQASRGEFIKDSDKVRERLRHWFRFAKGEVLLMEFPAYGLDIATLRRTIERVNRTVGDVDVLVLDYLDLLSTGREASGKTSYFDLGRLTHESRSLCSGFDLSVLTATQAVKRPEKKGRLTLRDMGDSYQKVRGADGLLSLVQTDEEVEVHQGRMGVLKSRDSGGRGTEIGLYINRELSVISELTHPNTVALMRRLKHLPAGTP